MNSEWTETTLGEFVRLQRGHDLTASEQQPGPYPVMGSAGPNGYHNVAKAPGPGVVVGRSGASMGKVHYSEGDYWPHNTCLYVTDFQGNSPRFAYYLLSTLDLAGYNSGSAQPSLNRNYIYGMPLKVPRRVEQDAVVTVLSAIDDRISLLRETNSTLESIVQSLFKSWFVDFDPVRAKQKGRAPEGMDEATAALFPDGFEDSVLGMVPRGWRTEAVYSLAQFINGASYKAFEPNLERRGLPIVKIAELKAGVTAQTAFSDVEMPQKYRLKAGDILFSWSGNPDTSIDTFVWSHDDALLNQHIFKVVPRGVEDRSFILPALKHLKPVFTELARNKQTTGLGHVTVADLKRLQIAKPVPKILAAWCKVISPILDLAFGVTQQAQTLASLRDTLLPRLISGQLRLKDTSMDQIT